jgi:hypothetical protein
MLRTSLFLATLALLTLAACGGTITSSESAGTTSGAGGATGAASTSTTTSAASSSSSGSASSTASGASSSASGAGGGCGTLTLSVDGAPAQVFASDCAGTMWDGEIMVALGWYSPTPVQGDLALDIVGCESEVAGAEGLVLVLDGATPGPMSYTSGSATFRTGQGQSWSNQGSQVVYPVHVTITPDDSEIAGTFSLTVVDAEQATHMLTGELHVCRAPFSLPP